MAKRRRDLEQLLLRRPLREEWTMVKDLPSATREDAMWSTEQIRHQCGRARMPADDTDKQLTAFRQRMMEPLKEVQQQAAKVALANHERWAEERRELARQNEKRRRANVEAFRKSAAVAEEKQKRTDDERMILIDLGYLNKTLAAFDQLYQRFTYLETWAEHHHLLEAEHSPGLRRPTECWAADRDRSRHWCVEFCECPSRRLLSRAVWWRLLRQPDKDTDDYDAVYGQRLAPTPHGRLRDYRVLEQSRGGFMEVFLYADGCIYVREDQLAKSHRTTLLLAHEALFGPPDDSFLKLRIVDGAAKVMSMDKTVV